MKYQLLICCILTFSAVLWSQTSQALDCWSLPLTERHWRTLKVPGERENQFELRDNAFIIRSKGSVSFRYFELPDNLTAPTEIRWRWRVDTVSSTSSQVLKGKDDRPLAVHVWFDDTDGKSLFGPIARILGYPQVGHLLTYVWGAEETAGSILPNPHHNAGRLFVLVGQDGKTQTWQSVRRNIAQDYERAFGYAPDLSTLRYIAISADNDDLGGSSSAAISALALLSSKYLP